MPPKSMWIIAVQNWGSPPFVSDDPRHHLNPRLVAVRNRHAKQSEGSPPFESKVRRRLNLIAGVEMQGSPSTFESEDHLRRSKQRFAAVQIRMDHHLSNQRTSRLMMNHGGNPTYRPKKPGDFKGFWKVHHSPPVSATFVRNRLLTVIHLRSAWRPGWSIRRRMHPTGSRPIVRQTGVRAKKLRISNHLAVMSEILIQSSVHGFNHIRVISTLQTTISTQLIIWHDIWK